MNDVRLSPEHHDREETDLAIGCFAALCRDRLADRLLRFSDAAPGVTIGVHELALAELLPAVRDGGVALAVAPADAGGCGAGCAELAATTLWREQAVVAMAPAHPLAAARTLTAEALLDTVTLLSCERAEAEMGRYLLARLFAGARPPLDARPNRGGDLLGRVAAGEGVALMLAGQRLPAGLVSRPVATEEATFAVQAWWRADHASPALSRLLPLLGG